MVLPLTCVVAGATNGTSAGNQTGFRCGLPQIDRLAFPKTKQKVFIAHYSSIGSVTKTPHMQYTKEWKKLQ